MPMTDDSTTDRSQKDSLATIMRKPSNASISFIRQFAKAYTVVAGVGMILN